MMNEITLRFYKTATMSIYHSRIFRCVSLCQNQTSVQ